MATLAHTLMGTQSSILNFSIKKRLAAEPDSFTRARIKILFTILVFTHLKLIINIAVAFQFHQYLQLYRAIGMLAVFSTFMVLLLNDKKYVGIVTHCTIFISLSLIWSNIFIFLNGLNIITLQFVFMIVVSSFYLLPKKFGVLYSLLSIFPVIIAVLVGHDLFQGRANDAEIASPGFEIIVVLNFVTLVVSHYLYHQAFNINVAEKEALNHRLQEAVERANKAAQIKSDFLSTMSHELRTPLNSVIGMTELLLDEPYNEEQSENLKILSFSAVNLHSLVNDILDFNKLESDKLHLESISVDLHELMTNVCLGLRFQAKEKGLSLKLEIDEVLKDHHVIADPVRISQIIYNLAGNAIKFTSKGSVSVSLKVVSNTNDKIGIRFSVADTGIGISVDKHEGIFEPFVQASTSTTRNYGGTGLGLAIVKRLLALFNSEIVLESAPGKGSNFYFDIVFKVDDQPLQSRIAGPESKYDLSGLRILIAEDNSMNRLLMKKIFSKWDNEPVFAENGQEALDKFSAEPFDVVLMDIHMPLMDGYEATKAIRQLQDPQKAAIHIIALTASVSNNLSEKIREAGMNDHIYKPFNTKNLYRKLKDIAVKEQAGI